MFYLLLIPDEGKTLATNTQKHDKNVDKNMKSVSMINGYWYYFEVDGLEITAHSSAYSGKQTIYINDNPVSEKGNIFTTINWHVFQHNGKHYKVIFSESNLARSEVVCKLYVGGTLDSVQTKAYFEKGYKGLFRLFTILIISSVTGMGIASLLAFMFLDNGM